jgi:hypothetical protein
MKHKRGLMFGGALALAGMLLLSGPALAQNQGRNRGAGPMGQGQGNQLCTGGPGGTCAVNPPNNPGNQNSLGNGEGNSQRRRGPKGQGGGRFNQPNTQTNPPATNQ